MSTSTAARPAMHPVMTPGGAGVLVMVGVSLGWGCSFLLIRESLLVTDASGVAWSRVAIGAVVVGCLPASHRRLGPGAWPRIVALALSWMAVPMVLFPLAQREVSSATAGMINSSAPVFTAVVAALLARAVPRPVRLSTGACFALFAWLAGTLDPTRASVVTYAVPVIAWRSACCSGANPLTPSHSSGLCWCW